MNQLQRFIEAQTNPLNSNLDAKKATIESFDSKIKFCESEIVDLENQNRALEDQNTELEYRLQKSTEEHQAQMKDYAKRKEQSQKSKFLTIKKLSTELKAAKDRAKESQHEKEKATSKLTLIQAEL